MSLADEGGFYTSLDSNLFLNSTTNDMATFTMPQVMDNASANVSVFVPASVSVSVLASITATMSVILLDDGNYTLFYNAVNVNNPLGNKTGVGPSAPPRFNTEMPIWLIPCYSVILLFAIVGNLLVISTLLQNRRMRTITNLFLLNLAISDILLGVLCMPVTLVGTLLRHFIFGEFLCKLIQFSQATSVAVSSWTLVAISCERYYAICHPLRSRTWQTINHAYKIIGFIWIGSVACMTPIAVFSQLRPTNRQGLRKCREYWPRDALGYERLYNILLDVILLVLPLMILCFAYILITRTLYVGMKNERAMIFGNSSNKLTTQPDTVDMVATSTTTTGTTSSSNNMLSINMSFRWHSRSGNGMHGGGSSICSGRPGSCSSFGHVIPEMRLACQHQRQQQQQQQHQLACHDTSALVSSKRKLLTASNDHRHLYCMRSVSMKSLHRTNNSHGSGNGSGSNYLGGANGSGCIGACSAGGGGGIGFGAMTTQSMIVTNVPQQQRFKLNAQRHLHQPDEACGARGNEGALRRTNTTKNLESKRRVVKMMFVLVLEFFICWTPLYVINTLAMFLGPTLYEYIDYTSISFLQLLAYSSSCCNPITYCFMNASFRRAFLDTFKGMQLSGSCCTRKRFKNATNLSLAGNSITLASSGTIMTTNTILDSPRL